MKPIFHTLICSTLVTLLVSTVGIPPVQADSPIANPHAALAAVTLASMDAGGFHTCGVKTDGTVHCWGNNEDGQATDPTGTFTQVSVGSSHTCGVKTDGTVHCWGNNEDGQATGPAGTFTHVSAGGDHTCGVKTDGTVHCWGNNEDGQATDPTGTFTQVSVGTWHTCGVKTDGTVHCWGNNENGQATGPAGTFTHVSAGGFHTCGVKTDGTVHCWGWNAFGQVVDPAGTFTQVSAGGFHTCGVKTDGTVDCWGWNDDGQTTDPTSTFTQVSAGELHTCGVKTNGTVDCWGGNEAGQAADQTAFTYNRPFIEAGNSHTCAIKTDGTVDCWGENIDGQATDPAGSFVQLSGGTWHTCGVKTDGTVDCWGWNDEGQATEPSGTFTRVSAGGFHTCGVKTDGTVDCWGWNAFGQAVDPSGTFTQVSAGDLHTCGVKTDGTVDCWGWNDDGQATDPSGTFTQVSTGYTHTCGVKADSTVDCWGNNEDDQATDPSGTFTHVSAGTWHTCGVKTDGTADCWGGNDDDQTTEPSGTFTQVSAGGSHTCGVKTDGTVDCWGDNTYGQAGRLFASPTGLASGLCESWAAACSLPYALSIAGFGNQVWVKAGTHYPTSSTDRTMSFTLKNGVAIYGGFAGTETALTQRHASVNVTILSGELSAAGTTDNSYHVVVGGGTNSTAILDGFMITAGNADDLDIDYGGGGGMFISSGNPTLMNLVFSRNTALNGGGLFNDNSSPTLTHVTFSGNSAWAGGGMLNYVNSNPILVDVTFSGNSAFTSPPISGGRGGGMSNVYSNPNLTNVTLINNITGGLGGGMDNDYSNPTLTDVTLSNNTASFLGGGMSNNSSSPTLTNVTFSGNSALSGGGGMHNDKSSPSLTNVTFTDNSALGDYSSGGGMSNNDSSPTLTSVTLSGNYAEYGGGMSNGDSSSPTLTSVTFSNNSAGRGGGMFNGAGSLTLTNVTFNGNTADLDGGGIYNTQSNLTLTNVTFSHNSANLGGGMLNSYSSPTLMNVIIANSTTGGDCVNSSSTLNSASVNNLIEDAANACGLTNGVNGNIIGSDPNLGPLANNSGFTQTMALLPNSPAIDAGDDANCPETDQRGVNRAEESPCDIGAYEYQKPAPTIADVDVHIAVQLKGSYTIPVGGRVTPIYEGINNGPVQVVSTNGVPIITSERAYRGLNYTDWNEMLGFPADQLTTEYWFPLYDTTGIAKTFISIGNTSPSTAAEVSVYIAGNLMDSYTIRVGGRVTPIYDGINNGPVRVVSTNGVPIITSERAYRGLNYTDWNEMLGFPADQLTTEYWFPLYDTTGIAETFISIGNTSPSTAAEVSVYIAGNLMDSYTIPVGGRVTPIYDGINNGPVRVVSTNGVPIITSERAYRGLNYTDWNEMLGLPVEQLTTEYWFPLCDGTGTSQTFISIGNASQTAAEVTVKIAGQLLGSYTIPVGGRVTPMCTGINNGPVQVISTNGTDIIVSERAYRGLNYTDWNEMLGLPVEQLTTEYWFPLYDTTGIAKTFISIGNASP